MWIGVRTGVSVAVGLYLLLWSGLGQAAGGAVAAGPTLSRGVAADVPMLSRGVAADVPMLSRGVAADVPMLSRGVAVDVPTLSRGVAVDVPTLSRGVAADVPTLSWGVASAGPTLSRGVAADVPTLSRSVATADGGVAPGREAGTAAHGGVAPGGGARAADAAQLPPPRTEEVFFKSGAVTLSGTLWLPSGVAPRTAMVLLHDADAAMWQGLEPYPAFLAQRGLAVLTYERRGVSPSWVVGIREWADDGLAAARWLRERSGAREVGLMGLGQGAWVAVHAAARAPETVAFLVLISGGGDPVWKQEQHRLRNEARRRGLTGPEVVELVEHLGALHDARLYAPGREEKALKTLDFQLKRAKRRRWFPVSPLANFADLPLPQLLEVQRALWRNVLSYDPAEDLGRLRIPVLALLGERDAVTPARTTARALSVGLQQGADAERLTLKVLPGADHRLSLPPDAKTQGGERLAEYVLPLMEAWLRGRPR
jgi:pimeloyl-ACP methyl ester carboxylesterase